MVRVKKRYLLCEIRVAPKIRKVLNGKDIAQIIQTQVAHQFGDYGYGSIARTFRVKYWNKTTGLILICVGREVKDLMYKTLQSITSIRDMKAKVSILHVGGTIKQCQRVGMKYDADMMLTEMSDEEEKENEMEVE